MTPAEVNDALQVYLPYGEDFCSNPTLGQDLITQYITGTKPLLAASGVQGWQSHVYAPPPNRDAASTTLGSLSASASAFGQAPEPLESAMRALLSYFREYAPRAAEA